MKTNATIGQHAVKNRLLKTLTTSVAFFGLTALSTTLVQAQPFGPNCTTTSIDISTGLDPTGAVIPYPVTGSTQDPYWTVTMVPVNTIGLVAPFCAELVDNTSGTTGSFGTHPVAGAAYISFATTPTVTNLGPSCGFFWTYHHGTVPPGPLNNSDPTRFTRQFFIEGSTPQTVTIDMNGYGDDILFIAVDATPGVPIFNTPANPNNVYYAPSTSTTLVPMSVTGYTITLAPGMHTIDVDMYDISGTITAINLAGTLTIGGPLLAQNSCFGQNNCNETPPEQCDDLCYWTVHGNNIQYHRNNFGTSSDDDVNIITNAWMRGIITTGAHSTGESRFGWNTMAPTAILHVNCDGNNPEGSGKSDIRFENLEQGDGNILVIDKDGYVFRTKYNIEDIIHGSGGKQAGNIYDLYEQEKTKREQLETLVSQMLVRLNDIEGCCAATKSKNSDGLPRANSTLNQNTPNPFNSGTSISYYVNSMQAGAYIAVYDVRGVEMNRYNITETGNGSVTVNTGSIPAGTYTYSLVIDGRVIDTKKMVFAKDN